MTTIQTWFDNYREHGIAGLEPSQAKRVWVAGEAHFGQLSGTVPIFIVSVAAINVSPKTLPYSDNHPTVWN